MPALGFSARWTGICRAVAAAAAVFMLGTAQAHAADVTGTWIDHTGQGAVQIEPCGERMCGRVFWLKNPNHKSRSGQPICDAQVLGDLKPERANTWGQGWIYNPEEEERFSAEITLKNDNTLLVTGYLGIKLLGETFVWKRAQGNLAHCVANHST